MIEDIIKDAGQRMEKSIQSLETAFNKIRTGRAHPSLLDGIQVPYYGADTPLNQLANITVEESRVLVVVPWERQLIGDVEKAIMKSDLGLNPSNNGESIRIPMPALTEETRRGYTKQAKAEAENARVAIRNIRRDANNQVKDLLKEKEISEDDQRRAEERIQKQTDKHIADVDAAYEEKEKDLMSI
ncbi:ribosome recycling factor [Pseudohongiella nitratireducens]|uniref:ribosome recycling factor n=1 Tax=Pseudohongiella nitratireducens TaxID=1768907 RepID=UPI00240A93C6|nr:ribosome recycling factor [Pseudohongiella nitratireducens]MDF1623530.1 ribosome recycling factor [Pseudohongiella nitratireducens]|tara:strand:+ start:3957 stop:4514 length:558 start_codon:yes stop_codon:yes gene_type:complete